MRCFICASDCKTFTTNLRKHEETEHETEIKKSNLDRSAGHPGDPALCLHWRRNSDASVELAAAGAVRMAANYLLAGCGTAGSVPHSVRRRCWPGLSSLQFSGRMAERCANMPPEER